MNLLESLLYGLLSGLTQILPVSSQAHQAILLHLFGEKDNGLLRLMIHLGMLIAVAVSFRPQMIRLYREMRLSQLPRKRRRRAPDPLALMDVSFLKTAGWAIMLSFMLYPPAASKNYSLNYVALFLLLNGMILFLPQFVSTGNKDARTMSPLDSVLIGLAGGLGILPGVSAFGAMSGMSSIRGGDRQTTLNLACLLLMPMLLCHMGFDIGLMVQNGVGSLGIGTFALYLVSAAAACFGSVTAIRIMRYLAVNVGFAGFSFYSWGAALFAFILYLTI